MLWKRKKKTTPKTTANRSFPIPNEGGLGCLAFMISLRLGHLNGEYNAVSLLERCPKQPGVRHFSRFSRSGLPNRRHRSTPHYSDEGRIFILLDTSHPPPIKVQWRHGENRQAGIPIHAQLARNQARPANSRVSVDTLTVSPSLIKRGTRISMPVSSFASLVTLPLEVSPRTPGSV